MAKKNSKGKAPAKKKVVVKKPVKPARPAAGKSAPKKKPLPKKVVKKPLKAQKTKAKPVAKPVKAAKKVTKPAKKIAASKPVLAKKVVLSGKKIKALPPQKGKKVSKAIPVKAKSTPVKTVAKALPSKKTDKQPIVKKTTVAKAFKKEKEPLVQVSMPAGPKAEKAKRGRKKKKEEEEDGFEIDNSLELEIEMLKAKKKKKNDGPKIIKTPPVMHLGLEDKEIEYAKLVKSTPAPKGKYKKFELEFIINASNSFLYPFFYTPSELAEWFADDVDIKGDMYTFFWDGSTQVAKLLAKHENHFVRFKWVDEPDNTYFEFRLEVDDITQDVALIISDFAEDDESREASTLLWNSQIEKLMHVIGA